MKLMIITDAWKPQINGVVTTLINVMHRLEREGVRMDVIHPGRFKTVPLPGYPEISLAINPWRLGELIEAYQPDTIHIATEGPLGLMARQYLNRRSLAFTTSLHTKFPEYLAARYRLPLGWGYRFLRWFHRPAAATLVTTESHRRELHDWGLERLVVWGRGVDTNLFTPKPRVANNEPVLLYVGRVAVEKNLEAFLSLKVRGHKVVVGDGPQREALQRQYPAVIWRGYLQGQGLAKAYTEADVLVFPSLTDTFGLVMLEAMACGTPVAAFPVTGPRDVIREGFNGALDEDLSRAVERALRIPRERVRAFAEDHDWRAIARRFREELIPLKGNKRMPLGLSLVRQAQ